MKLDSTGKPQKRPVRHQTAKALFLRYYRNFALADIPKSLLTKKHTRQVLTLMWQGAPTAIRQVAQQLAPAGGMPSTCMCHSRCGLCSNFLIWRRLNASDGCGIAKCMTSSWKQ